MRGVFLIMNLEICFANFLFHDKSALQIYVAQEMLSISLCVKNPFRISNTRKSLAFLELKQQGVRNSDFRHIDNYFTGDCISPVAASDARLLIFGTAVLLLHQHLFYLQRRVCISQSLGSALIYLYFPQREKK